MPQHWLYVDRDVERLLQSIGGLQDELIVLRGLIGLHSDHQPLVSADEPSIAIVPFLVIGEIRFLLLYQKDSKKGI